MPLTFPPKITRTCLLSLSLLVVGGLTGCVRIAPDHPYSEPGRELSPARQSAVDLLHREAAEALQQQNFPLAIETLQRAIRIEPRNPYSWHYLGQTYSDMGDMSRCHAMAQRSLGFSTDNPPLDLANQRLLENCPAN